jgi:hypothetical protein
MMQFGKDRGFKKAGLNQQGGDETTGLRMLFAARYTQMASENPVQHKDSKKTGKLAFNLECYTEGWHGKPEQ